MHLGIFSYNVEYGARPDELARAAEERGFESFWVGEHTHIPAARQTPYPGGGELPKPYYHMADPFVSLMAAAAATRTIKLGTGICLVVEHDPIVLAKSVATLDVLSGGRVIIGVGAGHVNEEFEMFGPPFDERGAGLDEAIDAIASALTEEYPTLGGPRWPAHDLSVSPRPVQQPRPPIWVGGSSRAALRRAEVRLQLAQAA